MSKQTAAEKNREFETGETMTPPPGLAVRQLWMVTDAKSPAYHQNWRVLGFVEGHEDEPAKVKFQFQIPHGPGKPAENHSACPNCKWKFPQGVNLSFPATKESSEQNQIKFLTEAQLRKEWKAAGATMVEAGQIEV